MLGVTLRWHSTHVSAWIALEAKSPTRTIKAACLKRIEHLDRESLVQKSSSALNSPKLGRPDRAGYPGRDSIPDRRLCAARSREPARGRRDRSTLNHRHESRRVRQASWPGQPAKSSSMEFQHKNRSRTRGPTGRGGTSWGKATGSAPERRVGTAVRMP